MVTPGPESERCAAMFAVITALGFEAPTAIQAQAIPLLCEGRDLVAQSNTGSGKTLAFGLPLLHRVRPATPRMVQALVLCPTRELCGQVARELRRAARNQRNLQILTLTGGAPMRPQLNALAAGAHVIVGTPGRVLDHLRRGSLLLDAVQTVVLDEADRMLEMGFEQDVEQIFDHTPETRQTVMFSATYPRAIEALSGRYQRDPLRVTLQEPAEQQRVSHSFLRVQHAAKPAALQRVLLSCGHDAALVFAGQKLTVVDIERTLRAAGFSASCLHGDLEQSERELALALFRNGTTRVLVATDVAARGIDVESLDLVVNYDLPTRFDAYVHRVGRTGRAGRGGLAVSLVTPEELPRIDAIAHSTGLAINALSMPAELPDGEDAIPRAASMHTLRIGGGRRDKLRPGDILGALTGAEVGLPGTDIGRIEIHERVAFVAIVRERSGQALRGLRAGRLKGRRFRVDRLPAS